MAAACGLARVQVGIMTDEWPSFSEFSAPHARPRLSADELRWASYCHMAALPGFLVGGLTFVGPLVCWLFKRDSSPFVADHGREAVNFQINIVALALLTVPIIFLTSGWGFLLTLAVLIYGGALAILAGVRAGEGKAWRYPATIRVV